MMAIDAQMALAVEMRHQVWSLRLAPPILAVARRFAPVSALDPWTLGSGSRRRRDHLARGCGARDKFRNNL